MKTATTQIRVRVSAKRMKKVQPMLARMGTDINSVINMLLAQIEIRGRLPFSLALSANADGYDYAASEYGLSREETEAFDAEVDEEIKAARRSGKYREIK